jgi:hypothetical protein
VLPLNLNLGSNNYAAFQAASPGHGSSLAKELAGAAAAQLLCERGAGGLKASCPEVQTKRTN